MVATPNATAAAMPTSSRAGRTAGLRRKFFKGSRRDPLPEGAMAFSAMKTARSQGRPRASCIGPDLDRHVHDVGVGVGKLVAYLDQAPEGQIGLLPRNHRPTDIRPGVPALEGVGLRLRLGLLLRHRADRLPQQRAEIDALP